MVSLAQRVRETDIEEHLGHIPSVAAFDAQVGLGGQVVRLDLVLDGGLAQVEGPRVLHVRLPV